jgi:hypothetical protein
MKALWPFLDISLQEAGTTVDVEDRFVTVVPYGSTYFDAGGRPIRGWNAGYFEGIDQASDVLFLQAVVLEVQTWMNNRLAAIGSPRRAIDPDRKFLFGYSNGGMMAYKLASADPNWRALWVQSASHGGKLANGFTSMVNNLPAGTGPVSLFAHHGDDDDSVRPGPIGQSTGATPSITVRDALLDNGVDLAWANDLTRADRTLQGAADAFIAHNGLVSTAWSYTTNNPDVFNNNLSARAEFRNAAGDPSPSVTVYRDPSMTHTNFTAPANNRYFDATDVWDWFKSQAP